MTTENKIFIGIGLVTVLIMGVGIFFLSKQDERLNKPLMGQEVKVENSNHVPEGTSIEYESNPPAAGSHYAKTSHAGMYDKAPADGNLVHSLEHGAVILWYRENLPKEDIEKLKKIFSQTPGRSIMTPRKSLDVPVAVSSWGRVLRLQAIDEKQIKAFFETNHDRAPEQAPI
ncbi:MAG: DUF3105 domain-containing protein [Candidatus Levybacteria bacterium]|nr:DUF3105 domain-containing protein [Candidatus Levybacteria bacterium]